MRISYRGGDGNDVELTTLTSTKTWTGAVSANWSDARNWSPQAIPVAGEALLFPAGVTRRSMINDLPAGTAVGPMTFKGDYNNYSISGNGLTLMGDLSFDFVDFVCNASVRLGTNVVFGGAKTSTYNGAIDVAGQTLTIVSYNTTVGGAFNGSGTIVITGSGIQSGGSGNFSGTISGTLDLNGGSLPNASFNSSGTLSGSGTIGNVTVTGRLTPGAQPPCCGQTQNQGVLQTKSLATSGGYWVDLYPAGNSDKVMVSGTVALSGPLNVTIPSGAPTVGQRFLIIDNDGTDAVSGSFAGLPEGSVVRAGAYTFRVTYKEGDGNDVALIAAGESNTTISQSKNATKFGEPLTITAVVTSPYGAPSGSVTFLDGDALVGGGVLQGGSVTIAVSLLPAGTHRLIARYSGTGIFLDSTSGVIAHEVARGSTNTSVSMMQSAASYGEPALVTATVRSVAPDSGVPTGSVSFQLDGSSIGTAPLVNGVANFTAELIPAGNHELTAQYVGDANFDGSSSALLSLGVGKASVAITLRDALNPTGAGADAVFAITVTAAAHPNVPAVGILTALEGSSTLIRSQPLVGGQTTLAIPGLAPGEHHITFFYSGDSNFDFATVAASHIVSLPVISAFSMSVGEGNAPWMLSVPVHLSARSAVPITVTYETVDGTATSGEDYQGRRGVLEFAVGQTTAQIEIPVEGDLTPESDETFSVAFGAAQNATIATPVITVTLANDDAFYTAALDNEYATVDGTRLILDLYLPADNQQSSIRAAEAPMRPVVVWIPGDQSYDVGLTRATPALHEAERGYAVAVVGYRQTSIARFPAQLNDLKAAVRWLRANAKRFQLDPQRIAAWGVGAGAHLAALLGTTGDVAALDDRADGNGGVSSRIQAVVDWSGIADLNQLQTDGSGCGQNIDAVSAASRLIGCSPSACSQKAIDASPLAYISADDPPFLIMHGGADCFVAASQSRQFESALELAHVPVTLHVITDVGHASGFWSTSDAFAVVDEFLDANLKGGRRRPVSGH